MSLDDRTNISECFNRYLRINLSRKYTVLVALRPALLLRDELRLDNVQGFKVSQSWQGFRRAVEPLNSGNDKGNDSAGGLGAAGGWQRWRRWPTRRGVATRVWTVKSRTGRGGHATLDVFTPSRHACHSGEWKSVVVQSKVHLLRHLLWVNWKWMVQTAK